MERELFGVGFGKNILVGDNVPPQSKPSLLFLHGAGEANRKRFDKLRSLFLERDIASCAFDFVGYGETGGNLPMSTLEDRTKQVLAIIDSGRVSQPLSIIAASMGGYTAIKLTEFLKIYNLVFLAPAVYDRDAYSLKFGGGFTGAIQKPRSWLNSDAWGLLAKYSGNLLLVAAEKDTVVPREIVHKIYNSASHAASRQIFVVKDATHPLGKWLDEHPEDLQIVFKKSFELIGRNLA